MFAVRTVAAQKIITTYQDPVFSDVKLLLDGSGSLSSNTLINADRSLANVDGITRLGVAAPNSSTIQLFSTNSLYGGTTSSVTGAGAAMIVANGEVPAFGTGDFTIELWMYYTMGGSVDITKHVLGTNNPDTTGSGIRLLLTSAGTPTGFTGTTIDRLVFYAGPTIAPAINVGITSAISKNAWRFVALSRVSGTIYGYFNGTYIGSATDNTNYQALRYVLFNGPTAGTNARNMSGYISDFRVTVGTGRYNSVTTIPIPSAKFPFT